MGPRADQYYKNKLRTLQQKAIKKTKVADLGCVLTAWQACNRELLHSVENKSVRFKDLLDSLRLQQQQEELAMKLVKPPPLTPHVSPMVLTEPCDSDIAQLGHVMLIVPQRLKLLLRDKLKKQFGPFFHYMVFQLVQNVWVKTVMPRDQNVGPSVITYDGTGMLEEEYVLKELVEKFELSISSPAAEDVLDRLVEKIVLAFAEAAPNEVDTLLAHGVNNISFSK